MDPRLAILPSIRSALESVRTPFDPKSVDPYRRGLAGLPGMDTKIYDDMIKQADSSAKLNFAIAMMQAGFGAAGASAKQGETPISTLSRTLLAPLSGAAGKVASDSRKEKTAARLGKLAADGRISTAAFQAALADKTAIDTQVGKIAAGLLKPTKPVAPYMRGGPAKLQFNVGTAKDPKNIFVETNVVRPKTEGGKPWVELASDVVDPTNPKKVLFERGAKISAGPGHGQYTKPDDSKTGSSGASFNWIGLKEDLKDKNGKVIAKKDAKFQAVRHGSGEMRIPALGGWVANSTNSYSTSAPAVAKTVKPATPKGMKDLNFVALMKTIPPQIAPTIKDMDRDDMFHDFKNGEFHYFTPEGTTKAWDEPGQKLLNTALKYKVFTNFKKYGGALQVGDARSADFLDTVVKQFFRTPPRLLLENLKKDVQESWDFPEDLRPVVSPTAVKELVAKKITQARDDNNKPVSELFKDAPLTNSNALVTKPPGRLLDMLRTDNKLFGKSTTGNVYKPEVHSSSDITRRLVVEDIMKTLPANKTSSTAKKLRSPTDRASVIMAEVNKKLDARDKKLNSKDSLKSRDNFNDFVRSIKLIDSYMSKAFDSGITGFVRGSIIPPLQKRGINPADWLGGDEGEAARNDLIALNDILSQISTRGTLKATGENRFTESDLKGAQTLYAKMTQSKAYNAAALKQMRNYLSNSLKNMLSQAGGYKLDDSMIEQALELGIDPKYIEVSRSDKGSYSKYFPKKFRKYNVTNQYAPGVDDQTFKKLEQLGVFKPFRTQGGSYKIYETQLVPDPGNPRRTVVQPIKGRDGKWKTIEVSEENLMKPAYAQDRAFSFNFFKQNLGR